MRWYVYDGLGSVLGEVDPSGNMTSSRKYDVYGLVRGGTNPGGTSAQKFVGALGHTSEDNTGLIYMRARYMDPALGRFVSEDNAHQGGSWFVYCNNNPVNLIDNDGNRWSPTLKQDLWMITAGGFIVAALFLIQAAKLCTSYSQGTKQNMLVIEATACAALAVNSIAQGAIGCPNNGGVMASVTSQINSWAVPTIALMTASQAATGNLLSSNVAVGAAYAYNLVLIGYIIAAEVQE